MSDRLSVYAGYDSCFVSWLREVDRLCMRFLDVHYLDLPDTWETGLDPTNARDFFDDDRRPEDFFVGIIIPCLRDEEGIELIDELMAQMAKWGKAMWRVGA